MADITRGDKIIDMVEKLGLQPGNTPIPNKLHDNIQPIFILNNRASTIARSSTSNTSGAGALWTTPNEERFFYLTALHFSITKDAACDTTQAFLRFYPQDLNGLFTDIIIPLQTTTAGTFITDLSLPYPLKIKKNTAFTINSTFAAGTQQRVATIFGYLDY